MTELPITPDRILEALAKKQREGRIAAAAQGAAQ